MTASGVSQDNNGDSTQAALSNVSLQIPPPQDTNDGSEEEEGEVEDNESWN